MKILPPSPSRTISRATVMAARLVPVGSGLIKMNNDNSNSRNNDSSNDRHNGNN